MQWLVQLNRAIDYIENNLAGEISGDEAARIACCSAFYFQRMFTYVTGISLSEYIRRRRMTATAFELQNSTMKVMDVAMKYGYNSPTAFNRAFQNIHGVNPTTARKQGTPLNAYARINLSVTITGNESLPYRIEKKDSFHITGVRIPLVDDIEVNFTIAPAFWQSTRQSSDFKQICMLADNEPDGILGVTACLSPGENYYYIATSSNQETPDHMYTLEIPAATWAIFESHGSFSHTVQQIFRRFYTEWLPFSGYEYAGLPDIEVYPITSNEIESGHSQVWIAIKSPDDESIS